jgi:hypothetical protein
MKNKISRNAPRKNRFNLKAIPAILILGTSALAANANIDFSNHVSVDRSRGPAWKDHQFSPSQDNDSHGVQQIATYSAVPETSTIIVAALLLLPLGVSAARGLLRDKKFTDQTF